MFNFFFENIYIYFILHKIRIFFLYKESIMENTKKVILIESNPKKVTMKKPRKKRVVTQNENWEDALLELEGIGNINDVLDDEKISTLGNLILKQIKSKINGYTGQDRTKNLLNKDELVNVKDILNLFRSSNMICYYCKEETQIMYEYVREPKQWTLERLDNSVGHNRNNVVISCLRCNVRRRCMKPEKYIQTKELSHIIKLDS